MNKKLLSPLLLLLAILSACSNNEKNNQTEPYKEKIEQAFREWKSDAINQEKYCPTDSCNFSYFSSHKLNEKLQEGLGLPENKKFRYLYADINNDTQMDALITFHPVCCTCSDTTGKVVPQAQVMIVSNQDNYYTTNDTFFYHFFSDSTNIHIDIDSIAPNYFYGTYFQIGKQDTSIEQYQKSISISYDTKEMLYIKRDKNKKIE